MDSFYAERYFKAFPQLLEPVMPTYSTKQEYAANCYTLRTFDRFLNYFGWIEQEYEGKGLERKTYIRKTDLFDRFIQCLPHRT